MMDVDTKMSVEACRLEVLEGLSSRVIQPGQRRDLSLGLKDTHYR